MSENEADSPFSHVPSPGAGPKPLQDGPFTYEKLTTASGGSGISRKPARWSGLSILILVVVVMAIAVPVLVVLAR